MFWCGGYPEGKAVEKVVPEWGDEGSVMGTVFRQWDLPKPNVGIKFCEDLSITQHSWSLVDRWKDKLFSADGSVEGREVDTYSDVLRISLETPPYRSTTLLAALSG